MQDHGPSEASLRILRSCEGIWADRFLTSVLIPSIVSIQPSLGQAAVKILANPLSCLKTFYSFYAFARRGKERANSVKLANEALQEWSSESTNVFALTNSERFWEIFEDVCAVHHKKPLEQLNRGLIAGIADLAQEVYQNSQGASLATWIVGGIERTKRIEDCFMRMVDVRGVGPKTTSVFFRDIAYLFNMESQIDHVDRLYVQPIDGTLRRLAPHIIQEPGIEGAADWILAGKYSRITRKCGLSGIRFNMGAQYYGSIEGTRAVVMMDHAEPAFTLRNRDEN